MGLGAPELLIVLVVVLLLFGGKKLPELARSLGQAKNEFEGATSDEAKPAEPVVAAAPAQVVVAPQAPVAAPAPADVPVNGTATSA